MAGRGLTEQIFFVYDHTTLQKEEDDLKDAIVYFFPPTVKDDDQCALCGQLMGMVSFFHATWSAKPHLYKLTRQKFVVRHVENRYTLALGRSQTVSDYCLEEELSLLYNTFRLYKGSLGAIREECGSNGMPFTETLKHIWECFLPFCCAYGDTVRHGFLSLPTIELPKSGSDVFLQASAMLQASKRCPGVLGGAVLSSNSVLCTQLSEGLTSRFLVIKPQQTHLPCEPVSTGFPLPVGVRIINVFVNREEYQKLFHQPLAASCKHTKVSNFRPRQRNLAENPPPYSLVIKPQNIYQNATAQDFNKFAHSSGSSVHLDTLTNLGCQRDVAMETSSSAHSPPLTNNSKGTSGLSISEAVALGYQESSTNQNKDLSSSGEDDRMNPNSPSCSDSSSTKLCFSADVHVDGEENVVTGDIDSESKSDQRLSPVESEQNHEPDSQGTELLIDDKDCVLDTEALLPGAQNRDKKIESELDQRNSSDAANSLLTDNKETILQEETAESVNTTNSLSGSKEILTNFDTNVDKTSTDMTVRDVESHGFVHNNESFDLCSNRPPYSPHSATQMSGRDHSFLREPNSESKIYQDVLTESQSESDHLERHNNSSVVVEKSSVESVGVPDPSLGMSSQVDIVNNDVLKTSNGAFKWEKKVQNPSAVSDSNCVPTSCHNVGDTQNSTDSLGFAQNSSHVLVADENKSQLSTDFNIVHDFSESNDKQIIINKVNDDNPETSVESSTGGQGAQSEELETRVNCSENTENVSEEVINSRLESQKDIPEHSEAFVDKHTSETNKTSSEKERKSVSNISESGMPDGLNKLNTFNSDNIASLKRDSSEEPSDVNNTLSQNSYWSFHGNNSADSAISVSEDRLVSGSFEEVSNSDAGTLKHVETENSNCQGSETFVFSDVQQTESKRSSSSETSVFQNMLTKNGPDVNSSTNISKPLDYNAQIRSDNPGEENNYDPPDDLKNLTLYIQGHSDSMLILIMEEVSRYDKDCIQALWKSALPQLGDLDFHVKELIEKESPRPAHEDYYFLRFNEFQRQVSGNVTKPVASGEYEFCDLAIDLHEEFRKTPSLTELCVRTHFANIYAHRSVNHEVYFQSINKHRQTASAPFAKDILFSLDQIAQRKLHKHHNITFV